MDKNEVLEKSRQENLITDERERNITTSAGYAGMLATMAACALLYLWASVREVAYPNPLIILFVGTTAMWTYQFVKTRDRRSLFGAIVFAGMSVAFLVKYFMAN
ncbi:MAG: DUF6442 family protein [Raoultibacter sp.]